MYGVETESYRIQEYEWANKWMELNYLKLSACWQIPLKNVTKNSRAWKCLEERT